MTRPDFRYALAALTAAFLLAGCGIKGGLSTPPPLWGPGSETVAEAEVPDDNTAAESLENANDPIDENETPFDGEPFDDENDRDAYGVDVAE